MEITYSDQRESETFDWLVWAAPVANAVGVIKDLSVEEERLFSTQVTFPCISTLINVDSNLRRRAPVQLNLNNMLRYDGEVSADIDNYALINVSYIMHTDGQ